MPDTLSQQPRLSNTQDIASLVLTLWERSDDMPAWGMTGRTAKLREFARAEPILSGALASMTSKAMSLDWQVIGGRNRARRYQELLNEAEDGAGWQKLLARWVQDYLNTDMGGFIELGRDGANGPVSGIYHLDSECVALTGNVNYPIVYVPKLTSGKLNTSAQVRFSPLDYGHIVDMPSPDESKFGLGFCSVSRAYKAAKVLLALYNYDEEKLADMPMPGLVTITGMTMDEVSEAFKLYEAHRQSHNQAIFKGLLWLAATSSTLQPIKAELVSFANLPENFNREETISLYIYTLALDFGVDAREFWPATQSGATKGEAEVQAQKAKGKGFGQMLTALERCINWHVLPSDVEFAFDRRNDDDDLAREILRGQMIDNVRKLWEPAQGMTEGMITTEEARRLLVNLQALPQWLDPQPDATLHSMDKTMPDAEPSEPPHPEPIAQPAPTPQPAKSEDNVKLAQKAARLGLGRNEDLIAVHADGSDEVLWTSRRTFVLPVRKLSDDRIQAALGHLQATGLLLTE